MAGKVGQTVTTAAAATVGPLISDAKLKQLYSTMVQCRLLTERACRLRNQGRSAALYQASMGQEAIATGCAIDLLPRDSIVLAPRNSIASLVKGVGLDDICAQLYERCEPEHFPAHNVLLPSSDAGEQLSLATVAALANKRRRDQSVVVAFTTNAMTALGCWHEALAFAAKRKLPLIFVVENNPWADPAGFKSANEGKDFTQTAAKYGLPGMTVDGNDVVAVYRVVHESLQRVRQGGGPVLVEGKTYRLFGEKRNGRKPGTNAAAWQTERDPLNHMQRYLTAKKLFNPRWKKQVAQDFSRELDAAIEIARKAGRLTNRHSAS